MARLPRQTKTDTSVYDLFREYRGVKRELAPLLSRLDTLTMDVRAALMKRRGQIIIVGNMAYSLDEKDIIREQEVVFVQEVVFASPEEGP